MDQIAPYHLKTLVMIAKLGTFQAAAEQLNMTQPAVSARMRELEAQLGSTLFQRDGRRMTLTARARQLVLEAQPALAMLDRVLINAAAKTYATELSGSEPGRLRLQVACLASFKRFTTISLT